MCLLLIRCMYNHRGRHIDLPLRWNTAKYIRECLYDCDL
jgi:hypothetical protein